TDTKLYERGAPNAPSADIAFAPLAGRKATTLFLIRKGFSRFFPPFLKAPGTNPCQQAFCTREFPQKKESNLILFPKTAKQRTVKIGTEHLGKDTSLRLFKKQGIFHPILWTAPDLSRYW